jgi:hypothetical protein
LLAWRGYFEEHTASSLDDYYTILGLDTGASPESIKVAYRRLARMNHPDQKMLSTDAEKGEFSLRMAQLNEAYSVLSDPKRRREYDENLRVRDILIHKETSGSPAMGTKPSPRKGQRLSVRPRSEVNSAIVSDFSTHLRKVFYAHREAFSWRETDLEGFDWALEAFFWSAHYCVALRGFTAVNAATTKKLINYSETAIMRCKRRIRKSYFLFLLPFQQLSEWELVSAQCQRFVTEQSRAKLSGVRAGMILLDLAHSRVLRFGTQVREKRFEQMLQWVQTLS